MTTFNLVETLPTLQPQDVFEQIRDGLLHHGFSCTPMGLPNHIAVALAKEMHNKPRQAFDTAGIGRDKQLMHNQFVRRDEICWIDNQSIAGKLWLDWVQQLQVFLNRNLLLGLFSFESHFAHYPPGAFYKKHFDSFKGQANRVVSVVVYLNPNWVASDGGELVIYQNDQHSSQLHISPEFATVVTFLSEEFAHEVLPANRDRFSVAGWFRVNSSANHRVDPPL